MNKNTQNPYLPLGEVLHLLWKVCQHQRDGIFYLLTEQQQWGKFELRSGQLVDIAFDGKRGMLALAGIKAIRRAKPTFSEHVAAIHRGVRPSLPDTATILENLGALPKKSKILVVEDSTTMRKVIVSTLTRKGYRVIEAKDGFEALAQLSEERPDMVFLDIVMPGIDGYKVLTLIREHDELKNTPVILLTARAKLLDKIRGKMSGSDAYLTKPFTSDQLLEQVDKYLS